MRKHKNETGITLIALTITIIVLLILAGVTITAISGDNGILQNAARAKEESEKAEIIEQIRLDITDKQIENEGSIDEEEFYEILGKYGTISADETTLITFKNNYVIDIADIGFKEISNNIFYSDTVDTEYKNNYLSCKENDSTIKYNMVLTNNKELTINAQSCYVILSVSEDTCYYLWFDTSFVRLSRAWGTGGLNTSTFYEGFNHTGSYRFEIIDDNTILISEVNKLTDEYEEVVRINKEELGGYDLKLGVLIEKELINKKLNLIDKNSVWYGKEFFAIGDSITKVTVDYNYASKVPDYLSFSNKGNNQTGGRPITGESNSFASAIRDMEINNTVDLVFIFGGHNDISKTIGNDEDNTLETLCGSLNYICENIENKFPNAEIIFATPIQREDESVNTEKLKDVANSIQRICGEKYGFKIIDLYNLSGITSDTASQYLEDGIHPNSEGHQLLTNAIVRQIKKWYN